MPRRRPRLPQQLAQRTTVRGQPETPALGVEVPLIPGCGLRLRRGGPRRGKDVLDGVATGEDDAAHSIGEERCRDGRRAAAPVVPRDREPLDAQRVGEVDHVLADRGLLGHAGRGRIAESRRAVPAKVRHQHAMSRRRERRRHVIPGPHIVRKPVQQDDGKARRAAGFLEADIQDRGLNASFHGRTVPLREPANHGHSGGLEERSAIHLS